jgi:hypothetical protein
VAVSIGRQTISGGGGRVQDLARAFTRLDPQQLVIVGDPASGKSVMAVLLTLALLKGSGRGGRVPVSYRWRHGTHTVNRFAAG